ncbi:unnamed protein product [Lactuca virosa]|uniref:BHLH domain-containing protein n=1 Tax=Lactuca virosa TaxID=75947 RepID=A0AAU9LZ47_9ASTR|nr:unnamed protein product [Lactuca virosa]
MAERNRRNRIKDGLFALRALVPKISKMDRASIVGDAIEYIKELQKKVLELEDELKGLEEDDLKSHEDEVEVCKQKRANQPSPVTKGHTKTEVKVEVHQIGAKEFLVKIVCGKKRGECLRTMEIVDSLRLEVVDIHVTTCNGQVLNILKVEVKGKEVAAENLKDSLLKKLGVLYAY